VVVITRDRPPDLENCLNAVLASTFRDFELVVVDQSTRPGSAEVTQRAAAHDTRVRLVLDPGTGASRARNIGIDQTTGDVIAFTDDDCVPAPDWLGTLVQRLREDPGAGMALGSVIPAPHDQHRGFIVGFSPHHPRRLYGRLAKLCDAGISANVIVRRSALQATGGFDEMLGPGGYFPCAEDFDLTYRVLAKGYAVLHVPEARVTHFGWRALTTSGGLMRRTYVATGAAYMKHVRLRDGVGVLLLGQELGRASLNIGHNLVRRRGPFGFGRLGGLLVGMWRSFELPVEREHLLYSSRS
jgi:GT2 family glycosyltransferase